MSLYAAFLILLLAAGIMFLIWRFVEGPGWKKGLLIACGIALVFWLFNVLGVFGWMKGADI